MEILKKLADNIHNMFELHDQQHEKLLQLIAALYVKEYKIKNPDKESVVLASYYLKDLKSGAIDKRPTYECIESNDHKKLDRLQRKYGSQYRKLELKSYDISHIKIDKDDKMLACLQNEITSALN